MTKLELLELVILGIIALTVILYWLIMAIKNGWIQKITETMNKAIKYAELNIEGGQAKKEYVLNQIEAKCTELGIPFTFIYKLVSKLVDKIIANYNVIKK